MLDFYLVSIYGKTIIKPVETDTIVKDNRDDFEKYISYNYNYVHCGVEILSMSKRIMNKVFSCADDCGIQIYYQGSDSIHFNYGDID